MRKAGLTTLKMLGVVALAASVVSVWPGCKDGSAGGAGSNVGQRTVNHKSGGIAALLAAPGVTARAAMRNPTTSRLWRRQLQYNAATQSTYPPADSKTVVAAAYGKNSLYIAIINCGPNPWYLPGAMSSVLWQRDCDEIWLDTSRRQNGTNFYEITIAPNGQFNQEWHRTSTPPAPNPDGTVNFLQPYSLIPWKAKGLEVKASHGIFHGRPTWNIVARIPLGDLPQPLRVKPRAGMRLRANVLRYLWRPGSSPGHRRLVQYNLFPVPLESQAFAPYCMGRLILATSLKSDLTMAQPAGK